MIHLFRPTCCIDDVEATGRSCLERIAIDNQSDLTIAVYCKSLYEIVIQCEIYLFLAIVHVVMMV